MRSPDQLRDTSSSSRDSDEAALAAIEDMASEIPARAAEIEEARRLPLDLVNKLKSIGIFRMYVPRSRGGLELSLPAGLEIITALSGLDGSLGWTALVGSNAPIADALGRRETYERIYQKGPDAIVAGSAHPTGTAEPTSGGWRVSGRWPFASGCQHADWLIGFCRMPETGKPAAGSREQPM